MINEGKYRQGDLLLIPSNNRVSGNIETFAINGHVFKDVRVSSDKKYIYTDRPVKVKHKDYKTITLQAGSYVVLLDVL